MTDLTATLALPSSAPLPITADTPFRATGDCPFDVWLHWLNYLDSPFREPTLARACYDACKGLTALALARAIKESTAGRDPDARAAKNPMRLFAADGATLIRFVTWPASFASFFQRMTDPAYKPSHPGVYMPWNMPMGRFIKVYVAGPNDGYANGESAESVALDLRQTLERINDYRKPESPTPPSSNLVFGRVPHPPHEKKLVVKPWVGAGYDVVPPRKIVGTCLHSWWGFGDKYSLYRLFSTGGERQADALTDYSVTRRGEGVMLNDPLGTRAGYANGGSDGLEGDGPLFVRTLGVGAINSRLVSIEREGKDEPMTPEQMAWVAACIAYWHDQDQVPWDEFPLNPKHGCVTQLQHWEFATKDCPFDGVQAQTDQYQDAARGIMKKWQAGGGAMPGPTPPPVPVDPDHGKYPPGMDAGLAKLAFGTLTRHAPDGTTSEYGFDIKGAISNAWLQRGAKDKMWPEALDWFVFVDSADVTRDVVVFEGGWILMRPNARAGFNWI